MTLYRFNKICLEPIVVYTMWENEKICLFTQFDCEKNLPEIFENCDIRKIWYENGLIAVLI